MSLLTGGGPWLVGGAGGGFWPGEPWSRVPTGQGLGPQGEMGRAGVE